MLITLTFNSIITRKADGNNLVGAVGFPNGLDLIKKFAVKFPTAPNPSADYWTFVRFAQIIVSKNFCVNLNEICLYTNKTASTESAYKTHNFSTLTGGC